MLLPKFLCPVNEVDGSWYFSQAASVWQGSILKTHFVNEVMEVGYGIVQLPYAHPTFGHYGLMLFHLTFWCLLAYTLYHLLGTASITAVLLGGILLTDKTVLLQRPETISLTIALFTYLVYSRYLKTSILLTGALVLAILHPPNAALCILGYLAHRKQLFQPNRKYVYIYLSCIAIGVLILIFLQDSVYVGYFMSRASSISGVPILQFFTYSGVTILALTVLTLRTWSKLYSINYLVLLSLAIPISPYYYFLILLFPVILLSKSGIQLHSKITNSALIALLGINLLTSIVHPIYVQLENQDYGYTIRENLKHLAVDWKEEKAEHIYISAEIGSAIYTQTSAAKMLLFYENKVDGLLNIKPDDIAYAYTSRQKDILIDKLVTEELSYDLEELQPVVKGKLSIKSLYRTRTDSVGLWKFTF